MTVAEAYLPIFIMAVLCAAGFAVLWWITRFFRPHMLSPEKETTYECGEEPYGVAQIRFHFQYIIFAILFVCIEVPVIFFMLLCLGLADISNSVLGLWPFALVVLMLIPLVYYVLKTEEFIWI